LQKFCRRHVHTLFNVVHDKDFLKLTPASEGDITNFEVNRTGPGPTPPYVPNWDKRTQRGEWNTTLFDLLMKQIGEEDGIAGDDTDTETLRELFFERLERVRRLVKVSRPKAGESPNDAQRRFHANHLRKLAAQKPHTRRQTVGMSTKKFMKYS